MKSCEEIIKGFQQDEFGWKYKSDNNTLYRFEVNHNNHWMLSRFNPSFFDGFGGYETIDCFRLSDFEQMLLDCFVEFIQNEERVVI
jgi:hypothetical protein